VTLGIFESHMHQYFFKWLPVCLVAAASRKCVKRGQLQTSI